MNTADWIAARPDEVAVLATFTANMRRELAANSGKGDRPGWMGDTPRSLLAEIQHHYVKLHAVVVEWDRWAQGHEARQVPWARIDTAHDLTALIAEFAADVANMSMMVADRCGALPHGLAADAEAERMVGRRVVITNGDYQGRTGIVASYDADRGQLFVDLDAVDRPWSEPFTLACGPTEARLA